MSICWNWSQISVTLSHVPLFCSLTSCVWARFLTGSHTMPGQRHSQPTPTWLGQGCCVFRCNLTLHFWRNDRGLLRATAVTRVWSGLRKRVSTQSWLWRRKFSRRSCRDSNPQPFDHESGDLANGLSRLSSSLVSVYVQLWRRVWCQLLSPQRSSATWQPVTICSDVIFVCGATPNFPASKSSLPTWRTIFVKLLNARTARWRTLTGRLAWPTSSSPTLTVAAWPASRCSARR